MLKGSISYFISIVLLFFGKNIRFVSKVCIKFIFETFYFYFFALNFGLVTSLGWE